MAKADDYCGAKSCGCRADDYDPAYHEIINAFSNIGEINAVSAEEIKDAMERIKEINSK